MPNQSGVTLVELIVSITILSIISAASTTSFKNYTLNHSIRSSQQLIHQTLFAMRSMAITQGETLIMCASIDSENCIDASEVANWQNGWIVFSDLNNNKTRDAQSEDIIFLEQSIKNQTINYNRGRMLSFNYDGKINQNGSFFICLNNSNNINENKAVIINRVGRSYPSNKTSQNKEITC